MGDGFAGEYGLAEKDLSHGEAPKLLVLHNGAKDPTHFRKYYVETHLPLVSKYRASRQAAIRSM